MNNKINDRILQEYAQNILEAYSNGYDLYFLLMGACNDLGLNKCRVDLNYQYYTGKIDIDTIIMILT